MLPKEKGEGFPLWFSLQLPTNLQTDEMNAFAVGLSKQERELIKSTSLKPHKNCPLNSIKFRTTNMSDSTHDFIQLKSGAFVLFYFT